MGIRRGHALPVAPRVGFWRGADVLFLLHMPLIHLIAVVLCCVRYADVYWMFESPSIGQFPFNSPPGWGLSLPFVYLIWACVVFLLYPWFTETKRRRDDSLLSYV